VYDEKETLMYSFEPTEEQQMLVEAVKYASMTCGTPRLAKRGEGTRVVSKG
jgi:hypothetical protein